MNRKVCVVTGTRAEFGLLQCLMKAISEEPRLTLQLVVTGMHLSPNYGSTLKEIEDSGYKIDCKVEMLLDSDSPSGIAKSIGLGNIGFAEAFSRLQPDLLVVLGDRFEIFSAVTAALIFGIPVAHLYGGETTEGAFDEAIRHSISKMSHLHFVANLDYARRVIQLGEHPERVFTVGGLGVDAINETLLMSRDLLEASLELKFLKKNLLITFHPETIEGKSSVHLLNSMLDALCDLEDTLLIFTLPNADTGGRELAKRIEAFVGENPNAYLIPSMGRQRYLSCMQYVDGVIGNSSSGLSEAPTFKIGTVNIGARQKGRLSAASVISCGSSKGEISDALKKLYDPHFRSTLSCVINPYGDGGAAKRIVDVISSHSLTGILKKSFYDFGGKI